MSILDGLLKGTGDPQKDQMLSQGLLHAGLSLLGSKGNFGNALGNAGLAGLHGANQYQERQQRDKRMGMQDQLSKIQLEQAVRQQQMAELPKQFMRSPQQQALAGGGGPTIENAQQIGDKPSFDMPGYLTALQGMDPVAALEMQRKLGPKPSDFKAVGGSLVQITPDGKVSEAYRAPDKPAAEPEALRALKAIHGEGSPAYQQALQQYGQKLTTHRPGTNVSVSTGQKGFDNTLKLRGDFRSEPIYKAHNEVQSAHSQITQAIKLASPAGDLAAATKIMKILDPNSVVRESELGMAMAASGMLDRLTNYAQMRISGQKLTPTQRQDFKTLADALLTESEKAYSAKRGEYLGIAERNELNIADVVGPESKLSAAKPSGGVIDFGSLK